MAWSGFSLSFWENSWASGNRMSSSPPKLLLVPFEGHHSKCRLLGLLVYLPAYHECFCLRPSLREHEEVFLILTARNFSLLGEGECIHQCPACSNYFALAIPKGRLKQFQNFGSMPSEEELNPDCLYMLYPSFGFWSNTNWLASHLEQQYAARWVHRHSSFLDPPNFQSSFHKSGCFRDKKRNEAL